jgi:hypothetical protein
MCVCWWWVVVRRIVCVGVESLLQGWGGGKGSYHEVRLMALPWAVFEGGRVCECIVWVGE